MQARVKLTEDNIITFFAINYCCGTKQFSTMEELREVYEVTCCKCDEPMMLRSSSGLWYHVGERVFE